MLYIFIAIILGAVGTLVFLPMEISDGLAIALTAVAAVGCMALTIPLYKHKIIVKL